MQKITVVVETVLWRNLTTIANYRVPLSQAYIPKRHTLIQVQPPANVYTKYGHAYILFCLLMHLCILLENRICTTLFWTLNRSIFPQHSLYIVYAWASNKRLCIGEVPEWVRLLGMKACAMSEQSGAHTEQIWTDSYFHCLTWLMVTPGLSARAFLSGCYGLKLSPSRSRSDLVLSAWQSVLFLGKAHQVNLCDTGSCM